MKERFVVYAKPVAVANHVLQVFCGHDCIGTIQDFGTVGMLCINMQNEVFEVGDTQGECLDFFRSLLAGDIDLT